MTPLCFRITLKILALAMCHSAWRQAEEEGESVDYTPFRLGVVKQCPDIIKNFDAS